MNPNINLCQGEVFDTYQIIDHIPDIFLLVDSNGKIVKANVALETILGWPPREVIGTEVEILISPELRSGHSKKRQHYFDTPRTRDMNELVNLTALHKKGYTIPIDIKLSSIDISGETFGIAIVRDATKQRKLQNDLEDKYKIIKQTLAEKNHLLGIAAHDMRNPIGIIQSYAQILLSHTIGKLNKDQDEFIDRIYQSSIFTMGLLEDTLDFSAIESGTMTLNKEHFKFSELINEIMPANIIYAKEKSIKLNLHTNSVSTVTLNADKRKLHQVTHNLLNNAIKYSPTKSQININAAVKGDNLLLSIEDQGVGISKEDLLNLFQPFYRAKNKPTSGEKSTGLGLFITRRIVEAHNGKIHVNSVDGNCSIFSIEMPIIC